MATGAARGVTSSTVSLGDLAALLRRRWRVMISCMLLGVLLGAVYVLLSPPSYTSRAVVTVSPLLDLTGSTNPQLIDVNTATESNVVSSTSVAERVVPVIKWTDGVSALLDQLAVTSPLGSQILEIRFSADTPQLAAAGANAFAQSYLAYRQETAEAQIKDRSDKLDARIAALDKQSAALAAQIASKNTSAADRREATAARTELGQQIDRLRAQQGQLSVLTVTPGQFVDRGLPPPGSGSASLPVSLAAGLVVGAVAGIGLALWRDRNDDRLRTPEQLAAAEDIALFGELPVVVASRGAAAELATLADAEGAEADAYRVAAMKLLAAASDSESRCLLVVGVGDRRTPSATVNLAVVLAGQGVRVAVAGTRSAMELTAGLLNLPDLPPDDPGSSLAAQTHATTVAGLTLMSVGPEVLVESAVRRVDHDVVALLGSVDVVLLDAVNTELPSTALALGWLADASLLVVEQWRATGELVRESAAELAQVGCPVLGTVLVTRHRKRSPAVRTGRGRPRPHPRRDARREITATQRPSAHRALPAGQQDRARGATAAGTDAEAPVATEPTADVEQPATTELPSRTP